MDLISSNMVMVSRRSYNGKVKICQVHDIVLHFCLEKSREDKFIQAVKGQLTGEKFIQSVKGKLQPLDWKVSRVRFSFSEELSKFASPRSKTQKCFYQHWRSLITTNQGEIDDWISILIKEFRLLKVLDLSSHREHFLSSSMFKPLNHLKYLAVWVGTFDFHPGSHLPHLESLIVVNNRIAQLPASFWEMEKLRHVEIESTEFDLEEEKHWMFEGSSKLENLRILSSVRFPIEEVDRVDVLLRRCPNLQQLHIDIWNNSAEPFFLKWESHTQLQMLHLFFHSPIVLSGLQLPSSLNKLVLYGSYKECVIPFIAGLPSLEYLQLFSPHIPQSEEYWCLGDITFHKLKLLKLMFSKISKWDVSEESFPLLETLSIKSCDNLEEIPPKFADIPTLKQIKLIWCDNKSLKASAKKIKEEVEEIEGCDRIDITIKDRRGRIRRL